MEDVDALGTIVGVWAHPDDEAYLSGGIMASAVEAGARVVCVTATTGEAGFAADDARSVAERAALRVAECTESLNRLGVTEHHWLGYPDGGCHLVDDAAPVAKLAALMAEVQPDTVLTFGPDGMTGHGDHVAVSRWATRAVHAATPGATRRPCRLFYATKTPDWNERFSAFIDPAEVMMVDDMEPPAVARADLDLYFRAEGPMLERKLEALYAQASQIRPLYDAVGEAAFVDLTAEEFFRLPTPDDWPPEAWAGSLPAGAG